MALIHYWAEINTGGRFPATSGTVYVRVQDLFSALQDTYGSEDVVTMEQDYWQITYAATASGSMTTNIIYISGVDVGTGFRVQLDESLAYTEQEVVSSYGWSDYIASSAVSLS